MKYWWFDTAAKWTVILSQRARKIPVLVDAILYVGTWLGGQNPAWFKKPLAEQVAEVAAQQGLTIEQYNQQLDASIEKVRALLRKELKLSAPTE